MVKRFLLEVALNTQPKDGQIFLSREWEDTEAGAPLF